MDWSIALILFQDGIVNGVIYALLGLALVLVFTSPALSSFHKVSLSPLVHSRSPC